MSSLLESRNCVLHFRTMLDVQRIQKKCQQTKTGCNLYPRLRDEERRRKFGDKCSYAHRQADEQPCKKFKKNSDKIAVAMLKNTRQLGCVFQDMEPPKSSSILRKSSDIRKPIRCVQFTEDVLRHANIRDQKPSLGVICPGDPHQRNPNAPKFEDRSQEETEWQERCAREAGTSQTVESEALW